MGRVEKTVFISYRRTNVPWALAIFQNLNNHGYDVFFDYIGIAAGDFESVILENIRARAHFLVLLTPSALERCGDPEDWLRREIEEALESQRNIVPLMLEGFDFGTPTIGNQLTGKLAVLKQYNALNIPADYFLEAMGRLRDRFLNVAPDAVSRPASPAARQGAKEQKAAAAEAPPVGEEELTAQQWLERGFNASDLDEKVRFYSEAIRLKPDFAKAFNNRGVVRRQREDVEGALEDFNEAIRLQSELAEPFLNRGFERVVRRDFEGALEDFNEAIRLQPDMAEAFNNRGLIRHMKGDPDGALEDYNEAIRLQPDLIQALGNRGRMLHIKGDLDGALVDFNKALRLQPDDADAFRDRGNVRRAKGDLEGALRDYEEAIRLKPDYAMAFSNQPDFAYAFNNRGSTRYDKGDLQGALADYDEAIRLRPDYAGALKNRDLVRKALAERAKN